MVTRSPTTNLLSKFSQLFSKSGPDGADSELSSADQSEAERRAALKQAQKYKKRADAIRAKELSQLRSIIRSNSGMRPGGRSERRAATPSQAEVGEKQRAILEKIDGAEAHLTQWWGTGSAPLSGAKSSRPAALSPSPAPRAPTPAPSKSIPPPPAITDDEMELDFTDMVSLREDVDYEPDPAYGADSISPPQPDLSPLESCLRDAAQHHAQGDFDVAHELLSAMLEEPGLDRAAVELLIFSLFDIYRCSGQQEPFEALALDYASRTGRSPGEWFSIADLTSASEKRHLANQSLEDERAHQTFWRCPSVLDSAALADLEAHFPAGSRVISINWLPLQQVDQAIAPTFAQQMAVWSESPVELQWIGTEVLMQSLQIRRLSSYAANSPPWWQVQFGLLCITQQPQAFEDLAMEYCVAFEMSPPSWKKPACKWLQADDVAAPTDFVATLPGAGADAYERGTVDYAALELSGNLVGNHPPALWALAQAARSVVQISVSCARLGRVDPQAAVALRDWLVDCRMRGCVLRLTHLPRLVLVYFQNEGIDEWADLSAATF